jgi:threonine/homoserine/homoserine lactone efflux protein
VYPVQVFLSGIALGFSIAVPPGPVNALAAQQVLTRSWLAGWSVLLGATTADGIFFVLTYYGVVTFVSTEIVHLLLLAGGAFMLFLSVSTLRRARRPQDVRTTTRSGLPYLLGLSVGLTNPYQLGWWLAVGTGMVEEFGSAVVLGFFTGIVTWTLAFSAMVQAGAAKYSRLYLAIIYASGVMMAAFGLWFLGLGLLSLVP